MIDLLESVYKMFLEVSMSSWVMVSRTDEVEEEDDDEEEVAVDPMPPEEVEDDAPIL